MLTKLREWKVVDVDSCILCWGARKIEEHIFHGYRYTRQVWHELKQRAAITGKCKKPRSWSFSGANSSSWGGLSTKNRGDADGIDTDILDMEREK